MDSCGSGDVGSSGSDVATVEEVSVTGVDVVDDGELIIWVGGMTVTVDWEDKRLSGVVVKTRIYGVVFGFGMS